MRECAERMEARYIILEKVRPEHETEMAEPSMSNQQVARSARVLLVADIQRFTTCRMCALQETRTEAIC